MNRRDTRYRLLLLTLMIVLVSARPASAWHFEIVGIDGNFVLNPDILYPPTIESFGYGPLYFNQVDEEGDREASSDLFVSENICQFEAASMVNMNTTAYFIQSVAAAQPQFSLRVVADPGDPDLGTLTATWSSAAYSESHVYTDNERCYSEGYVKAVVRKNDLDALDMTAHESSAGTVDLGLVADGTIISYGGYDATGVFGSASISSTALALQVECSATATASNSLTLELDNLTAPVANNFFTISCEVSEVAGPANGYTYVLKNVYGAPLTLTSFYIGTMDIDPEDYSTFVSPAGFTATVGDWETLQSLPGIEVLQTSGSYETYGTILAMADQDATGGVLWQGSVTVGGGETITFGFSNHLQPVCMEWLAMHPNSSQTSQGYLDLEIAGPLGTYSNGFVLAPGLTSVATEQASWGKIKTLNR